MLICLYVYMMCMCVYVYMCICVYVYMCICVYMYMYIYIYVYMYRCADVYILYVYMYMRIYVYIYMYICRIFVYFVICTRKPTPSFSQPHVKDFAMSPAYVDMFTHMYTHTHVHLHLVVLVCTYIYMFRWQRRASFGTQRRERRHPLTEASFAGRSEWSRLWNLGLWFSLGLFITWA